MQRLCVAIITAVLAITFTFAFVLALALPFGCPPSSISRLGSSLTMSIERIDLSRLPLFLLPLVRVQRPAHQRRQTYQEDEATSLSW